MQYVLGVLAKRFSDLRFDELVTLTVILFVCASLVAYAIALLVHQLRRVDAESTQVGSARRAFKTVGSLQDYSSFTD